MAKQPAAPFAVRLDCPGCGSDGLIRVRPPKSAYQWECDECDFEAELLIAQVRARRSKTHSVGTPDARVAWQMFNVRVIDLAGRERYFRFPLCGKPDLEMRAGDRVVFFFSDGDSQDLVAVANVTVRYTETVKIYRPPVRPAGCGVALLALAILAAFAAAAVAR